MKPSSDDKKTPNILSERKNFTVRSVSVLLLGIGVKVPLSLFIHKVSHRGGIYMFFSDGSITTKIRLLSSCYILLLSIWNQLIIQEGTIEGKGTSPPHSSNFRQDWISKLCYVFFFPVEVPLEDNCIFLRWYHILWLKVLFAAFSCLLPSYTGQIFIWQTRFYSGCPGLLFWFWTPILWHDSFMPWVNFHVLSESLISSESMCWKAQFASVTTYKYNQFCRFWMRTCIFFHHAGVGGRSHPS